MHAESSVQDRKCARALCAKLASEVPAAELQVSMIARTSHGRAVIHAPLAIFCVVALLTYVMILPGPWHQPQLRGMGALLAVCAGAGVRIKLKGVPALQHRMTYRNMSASYVADCCACRSAASCSKRHSRGNKRMRAELQHAHTTAGSTAMPAGVVRAGSVQDSCRTCIWTLESLQYSILMQHRLTRCLHPHLG